MNEEIKKSLWLMFVERLFGETYVREALKHPTAPVEPVKEKDVLLGEECNDEERFLYSFMPNEVTGFFLPVESISFLGTFCDLWWWLVTTNHRLFGPIGVRKGWKLVKPAPGETLLVGELHIRNEGKEVPN